MLNLLTSHSHRQGLTCGQAHLKLHNPLQTGLSASCGALCISSAQSMWLHTVLMVYFAMIVNMFSLVDFT